MSARGAGVDGGQFVCRQSQRYDLGRFRAASWSSAAALLQCIDVEPLLRFGCPCRDLILGYWGPVDCLLIHRNIV